MTFARSADAFASSAGMRSRVCGCVRSVRSRATDEVLHPAVYRSRPRRSHLQGGSHGHDAEVLRQLRRHPYLPSPGGSDGLGDVGVRTLWQACAVPRGIHEVIGGGVRQLTL